ncbi:unnamed protein product [Alopecurus aequalis]
MADVFNFPNGSTTDVAGVIMYVSPVDHDTYFPLGMREVAVVDANNQIVFLRIFDELVERYREQLLVCEMHASIIIATSMEVDRSSRSLLSTTTTTLTFHRCAACHQFDKVEGVRQQIHHDLSSRDAVKSVVLLRRDAHKPNNEHNVVELPAPEKLKTKDGSISSEDFSTKHFFNYLIHSTTPRAEMTHGSPSGERVNKMYLLD